MSSRLDRPGAHATDISSLLGIGKPGVWAIIGVFVAGQAFFTIATLDAVSSPVPSFIALAIVAAAAVQVGWRRRDPYPISWALLVVAAVLASTALITWQLPHSGELGREAWHHGANTWLLFFLALRGRPVLAWTGFFGMLGLSEVWALQVGRGAYDMPLALKTHFGILLVGTLFARALRRASARINELNLRSVEAAAAVASADAEQGIRRERVSELAEIATPLLSRISRAVYVSDSDRIDYLLAEATLRDSVRARGLHLPEIVVATTQARRRGVDVTLLDDRGGGLPTSTAMRLLTARITEALRGVDEGRLTIRLAPPGREVAASVVVESRGNLRRIDLDERGEPVVAGAAS